jgi:predicted ArsR family transcriptional regulator
MKVEGITIKEMAKILKIPENTVKQRIFVAGIKPLTREAIYAAETLEVIRNVPTRGRPRKEKGGNPEK